MKTAAILVIDDTPLNCTLLKTFLGQQGHDVTTAQDGETGLRLLEERRFDLVLLDWVMPPPDGAAVMDAIKSNPTTAHIPFLLISSDSALETMTPNQRRQFVGYLSKPFDPETVREQVNAVLEA